MTTPAQQSPETTIDFPDKKPVRGRHFEYVLRSGTPWLDTVVMGVFLLTPVFFWNTYDFPWILIWLPCLWIFQGIRGQFNYRDYDRKATNPQKTIAFYTLLLLVTALIIFMAVIADGVTTPLLLAVVSPVIALTYKFTAPYRYKEPLEPFAGRI